MDHLLTGLRHLGIGCHWRSLFVDTVWYADDLALLAPTPSALHIMLRFCEHFAISHDLRSNPSKTQPIRFSHSKASLCSDLFVFCGTKLSFSDSVTHFGHILCYDLSDMRDILRSTHVFIKKVNCMLCIFFTANSLA